MMLSLIKKIYVKVIPNIIKKQLKDYLFRKKLSKIQLLQKRKIEEIRKKNKIIVAFLVIHGSVWKYDGVYNMMINDDRFDPTIYICPFTAGSKDTMFNELESSFITFKRKQYNVINTYNYTNKKWLDIKKERNPDIIFFTNHHNITRKEYYIHNFQEKLTCYVQYAFQCSNLYQMQHNQRFHNLLWLLFCETEMHKKISKIHALNNGSNVVVTGYPGIEKYIERTDINYKDVWKKKNRRIKRIIWAPHHTIIGKGSGLDYSCFLQYAEFMLRVAKKYENKIQIAFKPHPLLKNKLIDNLEWGEGRTIEYFKNWSRISNGFIYDKEYSDLFLSSDAMIHDSGSFMVEYLALNKPVLFTIREGNIRERLNDFGKIAFEYLYHANNQEDIINFIEDVVLHGNDVMLNTRKKFIDTKLKSPNENVASKNIINEIIRRIDN